MTVVRGVLFDFGNTLFGHDSLAITVERCAAELGAPLPTSTALEIADVIDEAAHTEAELALLRDLDDAVWTDRWNVLYGLADTWVPGLGAALMRAMHDPRSWQPFLHTVSTIRELAAAGVSIGVVSNTGWDVRTVFRATGIEPLIRQFVLSYEIGLVKPDPEIFSVACGLLGTRPTETLMVGDDPRADLGAVAAGMRVLLLPIVAPGADNGVDAAVAVAGVSSPAR